LTRLLQTQRWQKWAWPPESSAIVDLKGPVKAHEFLTQDAGVLSRVVVDDIEERADEAL